MYDSLALSVANNLSPEQLAACFKAVKELPNQKISAIKAVRSMTGLGLREAKDLVEGIIDDVVKLPAAGSSEEAEAGKRFREIQEQEFAALQENVVGHEQTLKQLRYDLRYYKTRKLEMENRLVQLAVVLGKLEYLRYVPQPIKK